MKLLKFFPEDIYWEIFEFINYSKQNYDKTMSELKQKINQEKWNKIFYKQNIPKYILSEIFMYDVNNYIYRYIQSSNKKLISLVNEKKKLIFPFNFL